VVVAILFFTNLFGWTDRVLLAIAAIVVGTLLGQARGSRWNDEFQVIVMVYLVVHCGGLLTAAALFYGTGQVIDLHNLIFPNESRAEAYRSVGRLSGFHNEPGTYSQWTIMALYLFALTQSRLFNKWIALIAISVVLTVSLWGVLAFCVIAAAFAIEALISPGRGRRIRMAISYLLFVGIVAILALNASSGIVEQGIQYLDLKGELISDSGLDKRYAVDFMRQEFWSVAVVGRPFDPGFCPGCISPQDSGIGMTGTYYLGFLLFATLILSVGARALAFWGISFVVPIGLMLVWKAHLYEPLLWIIFGYIWAGPIASRNRIL